MTNALSFLLSFQKDELSVEAQSFRFHVVVASGMRGAVTITVPQRETVRNFALLLSFEEGERNAGICYSGTK